METFLFYKMKLQLLLFVLGSKHVAKTLLTSKLRWKERGRDGERDREDVRYKEERDRKADCQAEGLNDRQKD